MGITNNIPPSRLIQPGVIDNAAARPASPFTGQCIFQKDTNQLLVWNGTAWVIPNTTAQNPTGLELITSISFSNATGSQGINGCFSSTYTNYKVIFSVSSNTTQDLYASLRYDTSTVESGAVYDNFGWYLAGSTFTSWTRLNQTKHYLTDIYLGTQDRCAVPIDIFNPNISGVSTIMMNTALGTNSGYMYNIYDRVESTRQYTGIELTSPSGTVTGEIFVYGFRK